ncbi:MAG: periplasmic heavy metal sensor [Draconibacterium sp.]|nr:periplasmic heavy metal sensor [Draconibacterium sp.]
MKRQVILYLSLLFIFSSSVVNAQRGSGHNQDRWEKYRSEKIAFLTSNLELTPAEAEKFWPVYNQMDTERWDAQKLRREMEDKVIEAGDAMPDKKVIELTRAFAESMQKEGALSAKYNEEFLKILPPKKVLKIYKTEKEFRMYIIKKYRDRDKNSKTE